MTTVVQLKHPSQGMGVRAQSNRQRSAIASWPKQAHEKSNTGQWIFEAVQDTDFHWLARSLWSNQPNLSRATERLAEFITPWFPDCQGKPLLPKAIAAAVESAGAAIGDGDGERLGRLTAAYLQGLVSIADELACIHVTGVDQCGGLCRWGFSEPLIDWMSEKQLHDVLAHRAEPAANDAMILGMRTHLIARLTDPVDAGYLAKYALHGGRL